MDNKVKVHIEYYDKTFLNGFITSKLKDNVWLMDEDKLGKIYVFTKDIMILQQYLKKEDRE